MLQTKSKSLLKVIDEHITKDDLKLMMRWRKENERFYAEQPKITQKSFRKWFDEYYLAKRRILFFVVHKGRKIGHMGLYEIWGNRCKIDNVLRGETVGKGVMSLALQELLSIAKRLFPDIYLKVRLDNKHAIEFYKRNGFIPREKTFHRGIPSLRMKYEDSR